eukprot:gene32338-5384_t
MRMLELYKSPHVAYALELRLSSFHRSSQLRQSPAQPTAKPAILLLPRIGFSLAPHSVSHSLWPSSDLQFQVLAYMLLHTPRILVSAFSLFLHASEWASNVASKVDVRTFNTSIIKSHLSVRIHATAARPGVIDSHVPTFQRVRVALPSTAQTPLGLRSGLTRRRDKGGMRNLSANLKIRLAPIYGLASGTEPPPPTLSQQFSHLSLEAGFFLEACADQFFLQLRLWWLDVYIFVLDFFPNLHESLQRITGAKTPAQVDEQNLKLLSEQLEEVSKETKGALAEGTPIKRKVFRKKASKAMDLQQEQQHLRFTLTEAPIQMSAVAGSPLVRCMGLLVVLAVAGSAVPALWTRYRESNEMSEALEEQKRINAQSLRRQKNRFQQALHFDSINLDLPGIKVTKRV